MICDLAESYGIFDYKRLPPRTVASFLIGLRPESRLVMKLNNQKVPLNTMLLARAVDNLSILIWMKTQDGQKGRNKPLFFTDLLCESDQEVEKPQGYASGEDFEKERRRILSVIEGGEKQWQN